MLKIELNLDEKKDNDLCHWLNNQEYTAWPYIIKLALKELMKTGYVFNGLPKLKLNPSDYDTIPEQEAAKESIEAYMDRVEKEVLTDIKYNDGICEDAMVEQKDVVMDFSEPITGVTHQLSLEDRKRKLESNINVTELNL